MKKKCSKHHRCPKMKYTWETDKKKPMCKGCDKTGKDKEDK